MNPTLRRIAVSGSAAVALLGGAAAVTTVTAPPASAVETHTVVERAVTAPVNLPDGRTIRVTGMGGYGHRATQEHVATVAAYTPGTNPSSTGTQLQTPYNTGQTPADYQQIQAQTAGGGTLAVGIVAILVLGIIVFFKVKHGHIKAMDAALVGLLGISLAGTIVGSMGSSLTNSLVGSLGSMLGGLG
ncbi:cobalamin biosynthesis Mg chelatase CobN [Streptomyces sp. SAI-119]|uniref:hypothetical protein n=1 Tax=Streptomyces sp. SAI-119 TaxID=2940541 RepID=UPI00247321A9|nr:hypothetical protein [Streptomyces sp. SAI-119]MDH6448212.1 cobalamin biosynthesis Mg chelatase CobN [Streptomyces sp. SAI-119]